MKRITGGIVALSALTFMGAHSVAAQNVADGSRRGVRNVNGVERIMSMRETLALSEAQISALEEVRARNVAQRSALAAEMAEMRSQLQAGQIRRSDVMAFMEDRRDAAEGRGQSGREELGAILNEEQIAAVGELQSRRRAFTRGRASARSGRDQQGRGFRGARDARRERPSRGNRARGPRGEGSD